MHRKRGIDCRLQIFECRLCWPLASSHCFPICNLQSQICNRWLLAILQHGMNPPVRRLRLGLLHFGMWILLIAAGCTSLPPAITGIAIFPSDALGQPQGDDLSRTLLQPPVPIIGVRPGADPRQSALFLNEPGTGRVAITLARGVQNFLLYTAWPDASRHVVVAVYLDHESSPALSGVAEPGTTLDDFALPRPVTASQAPVAIGLSGEPVPNHSAVSVVRDRYRVSLVRAIAPFTARIDAVGPWMLAPDNLPDGVGLITLDVQPIQHD
jgi:hypothetical protein